MSVGTTVRERSLADASAFAPLALTVALVSAALASFTPRAFSIAIVFLFAGPHNWMEARYFLSRLPGRLGPLRGYFALGMGGALALGLLSVAITWLGPRLSWQSPTWVTVLSLWESLLVVWVLALIWVRSQTKPVRDWSMAWPLGLALMSLAWLAPHWWGLALVYAHPLVALVVLDRELRRSRPAWRDGYRLALLAVPALLLLMVVGLAWSPDLPSDDPITRRIAEHAGSTILSGVSSHLLISTHTFLEMLHYGVWLVAIPLTSFRAAPWQVSTVPMARGSRRFQLAFGSLLAVGLGLVLLLWLGFWVDYPTTRDVYFTVAVLHVLSEIPFLLRML